MAKKKNTAEAKSVTTNCNSIPHVIKTITDFLKALPEDKHFTIEAFSTNGDEYQVTCSSHSLK